MQYASTYKTAAFYAIFIISLSGNVNAATITNLDIVPHTIEVNHKPISIGVAQTWTIPEKAIANYHGHEIEMEKTADYAIWDDHNFGPYKRDRRRLYDN